jgi:hypothetical protein
MSLFHLWRWELQRGGVGVIIIVHIMSGIRLCPQVLILAVAMHHTILTNHSPTAPGSW